ncbi:hypothetical protein B0H14DRAFT_3138148 [Mycena olivaceomarginata]|nr:hypothetical protein B0H14DRAFT_3138148 [Mycena olivaceomarginata]
MSLPALDTNYRVPSRCDLGQLPSVHVRILSGFVLLSPFQGDDWKLKTLVTVALLVDTVSIIGDYSSVYLYTITHAGDLEYLNNIHWFAQFQQIPVSENSLISLVLALGIIIAFGGVFATSCMTVLYPSPKDPREDECSRSGLVDNWGPLWTPASR